MTSSFKTPLIVTPMPDGRRWRLFKSFTYHIHSKYSQDYIRVPEGFITDFASIPWLFWTFLPAWGKYGKAAVIHDCLYQNGGIEHPVSRGCSWIKIITRKEADTIFYEAMLVSGTKPWKAKVMYRAVRLFGWLAWKGGR